MSEWVKRAILVALVAAAGWKAVQYLRERNAVHTLTFDVDGPLQCDVQIHAAAGATVIEERTSLPWTHDGASVQGHAPVAFSVDIPQSCGWQPTQVRCSVRRDGQSWRDTQPTRLTNPNDSTPAGLRCVIEAAATDGDVIGPP